MKSLSIKKYLIFSIIAIYTIFGIGLFSVKAETIIDLNFDDPVLTNAIEQMNEKYDNIFEQLVSISKQYESQGFMFWISFKPWKTDIGEITVLVNKFTKYSAFSFSATGGSFIFGASHFERYTKTFYFYGNNTKSAMETKIQSFISSLKDESSLEFSSGDYFSSGPEFRVSNGKLDFGWSYSSSKSSIMYYITENEEYPFKYNSYFDGKYSLDGQIIENGSPYPSYYNYRIKKAPEIELSKAHANDLDGIDMYIITADFEQVIDTGLIYQIKIGENDWQDITSQMNNPNYIENYGYIYTYNSYWNTEFKARVLYQDGTIKDEKTISITELGEFGMNISHGSACDDQGRNINVITVDLSNCWNPRWKYLYSYDNEKWYNSNATVPQFTINHGIQTFLYFKILDQNLNLIYTKDYEEIFNGLVKNIHVHEDIETSENGDKKIIISVDFNEYSQFNDMYNLRFFINNRELPGSTGSYIIDITKENYAEFQEVNLSVYVDNFLVDSSCYSPKYGDMNFDDKFNQIENDKLNEELGKQDFSSLKGMINAIKSFLNAIKDFVVLFFKWIMRFFNRLNIWIRTALIGEFVVLVICRIVKAARK